MVHWLKYYNGITQVDESNAYLGKVWILGKGALELAGVPIPGVEPGPPGWKPGILTARPYGNGPGHWSDRNQTGPTILAITNTKMQKWWFLVIDGEWYKVWTLYGPYAIGSLSVHCGGERERGGCYAKLWGLYHRHLFGEVNFDSQRSNVAEGGERPPHGR